MENYNTETQKWEKIEEEEKKVLPTEIKSILFDSIKKANKTEKTKMDFNVEKEIFDLQEKINNCKFPMERTGMFLKKVRLLRLQELKELAKGINYKRIVEELDEYMRGKK